jgi:hypothetical protein
VIARLWTRHRWLLLGFVLAVALTLFFAIRAVVFSLYWTDPAHRDEAIAGWMTPRYIAYSWEVPPEVIGEALGLQPDGNSRRMTIGEYARETGTSVEDVAARLTGAITAYRAER